MAIEYQEYQLQEQLDDAVRDILNMEKQHRSTLKDIKCLKALPVTPQNSNQITILQDRRDALEKQLPVLWKIRDDLSAAVAAL